MNSLIYVAHEFGGNAINLSRASHWTAELCRVFPEHVFWAPWIPLCLYWTNEGDTLERGMEFDAHCVQMSRSVVQVGPSLSPGMRLESAPARCVHSLIGMPIEKLQDADLVRSLRYHLERDIPFDFIGRLKG